VGAPALAAPPLFVALRALPQRRLPADRARLKTRSPGGDASLRTLERGRRGGVFYLHGDDELRKDEAARRLVDAHLDPATRDFNFDLLRGADVDVERLASVLATPPMMAEWRVVLLQGTETLVQSARARDVLMEVVRKPPPGLALILTASVPDRSRARIYKELESAAHAIEFPAVSPNDVPAWLVERGRERHGVELDEDAARALGSAVGTDLGVLAQELEKLSTFVGERRHVTREDVEAAGIRLPRQDRWQWFDMVGERRFAEAVGSLGTLLAQNESGVGLVAGLGTHLLRLAVGLNGGQGALERALGSQQWLARRLMPQAKRWPPEELEDAIVGLLRVDRLLKASGLSEEVLLEEWLLARMVRGARHAPAGQAAFSTLE
jgi:DNA polymerase-3 subunit delta